MEEIVDTGIDLIRFSVIGYNKEKYAHWMDVDNFELIKKNIKATIDYIKKKNSSCNISTYHLITDNNKVEFECQSTKN